MQARMLILPYLCLYLTGVVGEGEDWRSKYSDEDTIPYDWEESGEFEGDILIDGTPEEALGDDPEVSARNIGFKRLWPNGIVPYEFKEGSDYSDEEKQKIREAMTEIEDILKTFKTTEQFENFCNVEFVPKTPEHNDYVQIEKLPHHKCASYSGMKKGPQHMYLTPRCFRKSTLLHELLHVLGFSHQQSAHNRNQFIEVLYDNIQAAHKHDFRKRSSKAFTSYGLEYDFESIMHYSPFQYSIKGEDGKPVGPTMKAVDPDITIKKHWILSDIDRKKLKKMYCN